MFTIYYMGEVASVYGRLPSEKGIIGFGQLHATSIFGTVCYI